MPGGYTPPTPVYEFPSDAHRRALGNLGEDRSVAELLTVLHADPFTDVWDTGTEQDRGALTGVLQDLEAAGLCTVTDGVWSMTERGLAALTGPIPNEPPPMNHAVAAILTAEFEADEQEHIAKELRRSAAETRGRLEAIVAEAEEQAAVAEARAAEARQRAAHHTELAGDVGQQPQRAPAEIGRPTNPGDR